MSHMKRLKEIYQTDGLAGVVREDIRRTKEDAQDFADGVGEVAGIGAMCVLGYAAGPPLLAYFGCAFDERLGETMRRRYSTDSDNSPEGGFAKIRKSLNEVVYDFGPRKTLSNDSIGFGLGSFLTQEVNFRKVGGFGAPLALAATSIDPEIGLAGQAIVAYLTWPIYAVASPFGYVAGSAADALIGNLKLPNFERRNRMPNCE